MRVFFGMILLAALAAWPCARSFGDDAPATRVDRPKIGVVLGGGGALGFAHVGVLKVLEKERIPIDYIGGTSMGSIVAGLYASGMSPEEIQRFLEGLDWWDVLNDQTPRREMEFRRKKDDQRYFIEFGWQAGAPKWGRGAASGQKFNNLLQTMVLRSVDITDFDQLPVPFRAVATDLRSGKPLVLDHGNLALAMRASMAVPGAFTPVKWEGHVLVDGGIVDNLPVDVVRGMGADIILAVDVGGSGAKAGQESAFESLGDILGRTYAIMQRPEQEAQLRTADVQIVPDLRDFTASQFQRVAEIIPVGQAAAEAVKDQLKPYAVDASTYRAFLENQRRSAPTNIPISSVVLSGNRRVDTRVAEGRVRSRPGVLDRHQIELDLLHLYSLGEFEQIRYFVHPEKDGSNRLEYAMSEKIWGPNYIRMGLRLQSDFEQDAKWGVLLNFRKTSLNTLGAEWENELEMGSKLGLFSEFYQPLNASGVFFAAPSLRYVKDAEGIYSNSQRIAEYDVGRLELRADLGVQLRHYAELRIGPVWRRISADVKTGAADLPEGSEDEGGLAARLSVDRLDRTVFAREGYRLRVEGESILEEMGGLRSYEKAWGTYQHCFSRGDHTLQVEGSGGTFSDQDIPAYDAFRLGGENSFVGLAEGQLLVHQFGVLALSHRYRLAQLPPNLGRGLYAMTRFNAAKVWQDSPDDQSDWIYGAGVGLGADTKMGPLYLGYGRTDTDDDRFYFSLGTIF